MRFLSEHADVNPPPPPKSDNKICGISLYSLLSHFWWNCPNGVFEWHHIQSWSLFQSHDTSKGDIPVSSVVTVKWGDVEEELFTAKVTGRKISVTYQVLVKEPE